MSNPTTPFSWQMPTATDLVTDLPADFEVFGQAVATSMADLLGGTSGQILAKNSNTDMDFVWVTNDVGDITAVTAGTGISGGGTSGAVTITNSMATEITAKGDLIVGTGSATFDNLAAGANGETLVADSSTSSGLRYQANFAAGKNAIINGDCRIAQRGSTLTFGSTAWFYGAVDRFLGYSSANSTATISQQAFTAGAAPVAGYEAQYFVRSASTNTATYLGYRIEDVRTYAGQTVTVSFWAKSSANQTLSYFNLEQNFGSGGSASVGTNITPLPALTTSWQRFSGTVTLPSISGKTVGTGSYLFLVLQGDVNKNLDLWGLQIEAGSVATAFQTATGTIQGELAACQRYYVRFSPSTNYEDYASGIGSSTTNIWGTFQQPVTMRVAPTAVEYSTLGWSTGGALTSITSIALQNAGTQRTVLGLTTTGTTLGTPYRILSNNSTTGYLALSSEL